MSVDLSGGCLETKPSNSSKISTSSVIPSTLETESATSPGTSTGKTKHFMDADVERLKQGLTSGVIPDSDIGNARAEAKATVDRILAAAEKPDPHELEDHSTFGTGRGSTKVVGGTTNEEDYLKKDD